MRSPTKISFPGAVLPIVIALIGGCAAQGPALRSDAPGIAIRLPPVEAMDLSLRSEDGSGPREPPFSVAEETRDRWLTLFEVTVSPVSTGTLPAAETDSREP